MSTTEARGYELAQLLLTNLIAVQGGREGIAPDDLRYLADEVYGPGTPGSVALHRWIDHDYPIE